MYDLLIALYEGQQLTGSFLQYANVASASLQTNQFGGIAQGQYVINSTLEDMTNFVAPNRIDCYVRRDNLTQEVSSGGTTLHVNDGTRFTVGKTIAVYDGVNASTALVTVISGNVLTIGTAVGSTFVDGSTVLQLYHRGRISSVDGSLQIGENLQTVTTLSYYMEISQKVVDLTTIQNMECGWVLYHLLQLYSDELDLNIIPDNFVMTTDAGGSPGTLEAPLGTGQGFWGNWTDDQLSDVVQQIVNTANGNPNNIGNSSGTRYQFWVDETNTVYFKAINITTPTITYTTNSYVAPVVNDGIYDLVFSHKPHSNDISNIYNTFKLYGATPQGGTNPITVTVFDQDSVDIYGQIEQAVTNTNITDTTTLQAYGQGLCNSLAYPLDTYTTVIYPSRYLVSPLDFMEVTDTSTGYVDQFTPINVQFDYDSNNPLQFKTTVTGGQMLPNINSIMATIAGEAYKGVVGVTAGVNLTTQFVMSGLSGSYTGDTFSMTAGVFQANVQVDGVPELTSFDIAAFSFVPPVDGSYVIAYWYLNADGTELTSPVVVVYPGLNTTAGLPYTNAQVTPFYYLTRLGGVITNAADVRNQGGISSANINPGSIGKSLLATNPNPNTLTALASSTSVSGPTYPSVGGSYDASCTFTLSITNPNWLAAVRLYAVPAGQAYATYRIAKGDLTPDASGSYTGNWGGLSSGQAYDLYCTYLDTAGYEVQTTALVPIGLLLATTAATPFILSTANFPVMPANTIPTLTVPASSVTFAYPTVGLALYDAQTSLTFTNLISSVGASQIQCVAQPSNESNNWSDYNTYDVTSSSTYSLVWGGLGCGGFGYKLGVRYIGSNGGFSNILPIGTTEVTPIPSSAIANGTITAVQTSGVFDSNGKLLYGLAPTSIQGAISATGAVNLGNTFNDLAYSANSPQVTSVILVSSIGGTNLAYSAVGTNQVISFSVNNSQLATTRYDTTLANIANGYSGYSWSTSTGTAAVSATAGSTYYYTVGSASASTNGIAASDTIFLAPNAIATYQFQRPAFTTWGNVKVGFNGAPTSNTPIPTNVPVTGSDAPYITNVVTTTTTLISATNGLGSFTSSPAIASTPEYSYSINEHNSGYLNPGSIGEYSTATITGTNNYTGSYDTQNNFASGMGAWTTSGTTSIFTPAGNAHLSATSEATASNAFGSAEFPVVLTYSLPSTYTSDQATSPVTYPIQWTVWVVAPNSATIQTWTGVTGNSALYCYNGGGQTGTYTWYAKPQYVTDSNPSGTVSGSPSGFYPVGIGTYQGDSQSINSINVVVDDTYTIDISQLNTFNAYGIGNASGIGSTSILSGDLGAINLTQFSYSPTVVGSDSFVILVTFGDSTAMQITFDVNVASTTSTACYILPSHYSGSSSIVGHNGSNIQLFTTPTVVSPSLAEYAISLVIVGIAPASDANGTAYCGMYLAHTSDNTLAHDFGPITSDGTYTYYNSSESHTQFTLYMYATMTTVNDTGDGSYSPNIAGSLNYYSNDQSTYYVLSEQLGAATNYYTSTLALAPLSATNNPIELVVTSLSTPSNADGASGIFAEIWDQNGNLLAEEAITATGTYKYYSSGAIPGQYLIQLYGYIVTNNNIAASSYTTTAAGYIQWAQNQTNTSTAWTNNGGVSTNYFTPTTTIAPSGATIPLELTFTSATCPSYPAGTSEIIVVLNNTAGSPVLSGLQYSNNGGSTFTNCITGTVGVGNAAAQYAAVPTTTNPLSSFVVRYYAPTASTGAYNWYVYGQCIANDTANQTFNVLWSGSQSYYVPPASSYVLAADGITQRTATNDDNIAFIQNSATILSFQVFNNSSSEVPFGLSVDCLGV